MAGDILSQLQADPLYQESLPWGRPRRGHPEGSIKNHIEDLEANLERVSHLLQAGEEERLRLLIHVHDICKPEAWTGVPSHHPQNHAYLARQYLARFCQDPVLLAITQHHDDGYLLYQYFRWADDLARRVRLILDEVQDVELFLLFNLLDSCIGGKTLEPLDWFVRRVGLVYEIPPRIWQSLNLLRNEVNSGDH